ncbi:hypothetical protein FOE78_11140 [Microlunatus elymi]|uniref:VOC domain-containing protein n=1 Tax=Microlunatus elymi TaxID=2596828 RepID=A0A516PZH3_9ACTN|nr:hypothetical protein FOE78_11140 [Microlunatus elymi]
MPVGGCAARTGSCGSCRRRAPHAPSRSSARRGLLIAFTVADVDAEYERIVAAGAPVVTPIETEPWGERYFQVEDPNGLILQVVGWVEQQTR